MEKSVTSCPPDGVVVSAPEEQGESRRHLPLQTWSRQPACWGRRSSPAHPKSHGRNVTVSRKKEGMDINGNRPGVQISRAESCVDTSCRTKR